MNDNLKQIKEVADALLVLAYILEIPTEAEQQVNMMKTILPENIKKLKDAVIRESGESPWE